MSAPHPLRGEVWEFSLNPKKGREQKGRRPCLVVSTDAMGGVRVGPISGEASHLLLGHEGPVEWVTVSPDSLWIASSGADSTIHLWPMPDLTKRPLHTLPRDELIAKLQSLTNLRAVEDPESPSGWKIEVGPFPGWETVPEW